MKHRYQSLVDYCDRNPHLKERYIAEGMLGIDPARFSKLKAPGKYRVNPTEAERAAIAALLNQTEGHVDQLYSKIA